MLKSKILLVVDGNIDNRIIRVTNMNNNNNANINETVEKRSLSNIIDMPAKLDFSTLQSIAHQTGLIEFIGQKWSC